MTRTIDEYRAQLKAMLPDRPVVAYLTGSKNSATSIASTSVE